MTRAGRLRLGALRNLGFDLGHADGCLVLDLGFSGGVYLILWLRQITQGMIYTNLEKHKGKLLVYTTHTLQSIIHKIKHTIEPEEALWISSSASTSETSRDSSSSFLIEILRFFFLFLTK